MYCVYFPCAPDLYGSTHDVPHCYLPQLLSLLGGGKIAYQGPARLAMGWFASLGYVPSAPSQMPQSNPTAPNMECSASNAPTKTVVTNATDFLLDCTSGHIKRQRFGSVLGQGLGKEGDEEMDDGKPVVWQDLWSERGAAYLSAALQQEASGSVGSQGSSLDDRMASDGEHSGSHDIIPPPHGTKIDKEGNGGVKNDSMVQRAATVKVRSFPRQLLLYFLRAFLQRIKGFDLVGVD